ncbi:MAG TPA: amidase [Candidatus Binataceae bacterium]|nr:amidase [Candidatus Binataceae bacterium]
MAVKAPTIDDLLRIGRGLGFKLSTDDAEAYRRLLLPSIEALERLDAMVEPSLPVKYPRDAGRRPSREENPLNAWYWRCEIHGAAEGPLKGKTFAIKDNVCVAGIPMMNGTRLLEGFVPNIDATVVTRILDGGGTILGKAVCESLCFSGGSHTADTGPVRNPHDQARTTGGSSSGSGALVAAGAVDMAIGGDQGGSIRIPSAWCGIYGLKPTWGLVPYTGAFPIELTIDHLGPMARSAADCALMLEVIAGPDGLDPRQPSQAERVAYTRLLTGDVKGLRLAVVQEGFGQPGAEKDVDEAVMTAAHSFEKLGAKVRSVAIPWHREGMSIWTGIGAEGALATLINGGGLGSGWKGYYATGVLDAFARGLRTHPDDLSESARLFTLLGAYVHERYHNHFYAKAQNLARTLKGAYDAVLAEDDLLVMPTMCTKAPLIPRAGASREEYLAAALGMVSNTAQFNITGHPAMNVPVAKASGLPIGMMLIGRSGDDATVLRAADAWQRNFER